MYNKLFVLFLVLVSCSYRGKGTKGDSILGFSTTSDFKEIPSLTLPEYKVWLADTINHVASIFENDLCKVALVYRPVSFEAAMQSYNSSEPYDSLFKEKNKYHLFVAECLDKRPQSAMRLQGGLEFMNDLSKGVFVIQNLGDSILPIIETFPSTLLNRPGYIYIFIPKDNSNATFRTGLKHPMLGGNVISLTIDSTSLAHLPKIKI